MASLISVAEMIDKAFYSDGKCHIDFKTMKIILIILAKHMQVLERHFAVAIGSVPKPDSQLSISEVNIYSKEMETKYGAPLQALLPHQIARSKDINKEKIILVTSSDDAKGGKGGGSDSFTNRVPKSITTMNEFVPLVNKVINLEQQYDENIDQDIQLKRQFSFSDPMAMVQLSERLYSVEMAIGNMLHVLYELASRTPGLLDSLGSIENIPGIFTVLPPQRRYFKSKTYDMATLKELPLSHLTGLNTHFLNKVLKTFKQRKKKLMEFATYSDGVLACQDLYDSVNEDVMKVSKKTFEIAQGTVGLLKKLGVRLDCLQDMKKDVETIGANFAESVTKIDTEVSTMMNRSQEELALMQFNLEERLEQFYESMANSQGDPEATTTFSGKLTLLDTELKHTYEIQKGLTEDLKIMKADALSIRRQLRVLNQTKANRNEIDEKLKSKAGLQDFNGLLRKTEHDAYFGHLEKQLQRAYTLFNTTETYWQKAIDNLSKKCLKKVDMTQIQFVRDDIIKKIEILLNRTEFLLSIGQGGNKPERRTIRIEYCHSCGGNVSKGLEIPPLPFLPPIPCLNYGGKSDTSIVISESSYIEDSPVDKKEIKTKKRKYFPKKIIEQVQREPLVCYPKRPIFHPIDPRAKLCSKMCGGILPTIHAQPRSTRLIVKPIEKLQDGNDVSKKENMRPCSTCRDFVLEVQPSVVERTSVVSCTPPSDSVVNWFKMQWS